jgi:hypothetical protein
MRNVKVTLVGSVVLVVAAVALTLTGSAPQIVHANGPRADTSLGITISAPTICQANEVLPAGVTMIRVSIAAFYGSDVRLIAYRDHRVLTTGRRGADWTGISVTVPVKPVSRGAANVTLCVVLGPNSEPVTLTGLSTPPRAAAVLSAKPPTPAEVGRGGEPLRGRLAVEYLAAGHDSWWSRALTVARHMGIGHFVSGSWIALLVAALMAGVGGLTLRVTLRELG